MLNIGGFTPVVDLNSAPGIDELPNGWYCGLNGIVGLAVAILPKPIGGFLVNVDGVFTGVIGLGLDIVCAFFIALLILNKFFIY